MEFTMQDGEIVPSSLCQLRLHFCEPWLVGDSTTKADLEALCPLQVSDIACYPKLLACMQPSYQMNALM